MWTTTAKRKMFLSWFAIDEATARAEVGRRFKFLSIRRNESELPHPKPQIARSRDKYVENRDQYSSSKVNL